MCLSKKFSLLRARLVSPNLSETASVFRCKQSVTSFKLSNVPCLLQKSLIIHLGWANHLSSIVIAKCVAVSNRFRESYWNLNSLIFTNSILPGKIFLDFCAIFTQQGTLSQHSGISNDNNVFIRMYRKKGLR